MDTSQLCRICLAHGNIELFSNDEKESDTISYKLSQILHEMVEHIKGYPKYICESCYDLIDTLYNFLQKYKETSDILNKGLIVVKKEGTLWNTSDDNSCENDIDYVPEIEIDIKDYFFENTNEDNLDNVAENRVKCYLQNKQASPNKPIDRKITLIKSKDSKLSKLGNKSCTKIGNTTIKKIKQPVCKPLKKKHNPPTFKENDKSGIKQQKDSISVNYSGRLCDYCGELFNCPYKLGRHRASVHFGETLSCNYCDKKFKLKEYLNKHIKTIHGEKNFNCSLCGNAYASQGVLNKHINNVHKKNCPKKFYPCKFCGKKLSSAQLLLLHERAHTGERPEKCSVCDKTFSHDLYLKEHMRLHTGETPFKCPICGRGYAQRGNMKSHVKHNHWLKDVDDKTLSKLTPNFIKLLKT